MTLTVPDPWIKDEVAGDGAVVLDAWAAGVAEGTAGDGAAAVAGTGAGVGTPEGAVALAGGDAAGAV